MRTQIKILFSGIAVFAVAILLWPHSDPAPSVAVSVSPSQSLTTILALETPESVAKSAPVPVPVAMIAPESEPVQRPR
jgi:hypothetical protein